MCASIKPGNSVASPRSTTSAPAGIVADAPTATIFPPLTTTKPGMTNISPLPSNNRAAFSTYILSLGFCPSLFVATDSSVTTQTTTKATRLGMDPPDCALRLQRDRNFILSPQKVKTARVLDRQTSLVQPRFDGARHSSRS